MLSKEEYRQIARIHKNGIFKGFLSTLSLGFLALLYEAIDQSTTSSLVVVRVKGKIVGFIAGSRDIRDVYRIMLRSSVRLIIALLPAFTSPQKIFRIFETVMFSKKKCSIDCDLPSEELLSISVLPECRGMGYADELFKSLVSEFKSRNIRRFKIVVGEALEPAHRFYKRMGARPVANVTVHKGIGSIVYVFLIK